VKPEPGTVRDSNAVHDTVVGERSIASVNAPSSLQTRISHLLAMGLMSTLGLALLGWYYAHTWTHQAQARKVAENTSRNQAAGEMALPSLKIDPPSPVAAQILGPPPALPATRAETLGPAAGNPQGLPTKSPWQLALERRLAGPVSTGPAVSMTPAVGTTPAIGPASSAPTAVSDAKPSPSEEPGSAAPADRPFSASLKPSVTPAARARVLPAERLLLPKGAFIDCTLETAIDSTLPGMTTCVTATDTFGVDGSTVLIERGSKLVGETRGEARQGQARLFVLWTEARTPTGVVVPLASPGTDELSPVGSARRGEPALLPALRGRDPDLGHRWSGAGRGRIAKPRRRRHLQPLRVPGRDDGGPEEHGEHSAHDPEGPGGPDPGAGGAGPRFQVRV